MNSKDSLNEKKYGLKRPLSTAQRFTDEKIQELTCEALYRCQEIDSTEIVVTVEDGVVGLSGFVQDKGSIHTAESCVKKITEVRGIDNSLMVKRRERSQLS